MALSGVGCVKGTNLYLAKRGSEKREGYLHGSDIKENSVFDS